MRRTDGAGAAAPVTHFAPAPRASVDEVRAAIEHCSTHPMIGTILQTFGGVLAVLNQQRQILAVNDSALSMFGVGDAGEVLGLRPGEAVDCSHAGDHAGGCGTGQACASCGAAISIVACQREDRPQEADCTLTLERDGEALDVQLRVRVSPLHIGSTDLLLLFLEDVTAERRRASLERAFFHDVNNTMVGLMGTVDLLSGASEEQAERLRTQVSSFTHRLAREIQVQQALAGNQPSNPRVVPRSCAVQALLDELELAVRNHRAARDRTLTIVRAPEGAEVRTDPVLLHRVLVNMTLNALEASPEKSEVRIAADPEEDGVRFQVWNEGDIPASVQPRVFQRFFTTKEGPGRGIGTYAMKLLGEDYLRGKVSFDSSPEEGTTFRLWLPSLLAPAG